MSTFRLDRKKPCAECPFTKNGARGWLGPFDDVAELHRAGLDERGYACHVSQKENSHLPLESTHQCIGALCYASEVFKSFQNPVLEAKRKELKGTCPGVLNIKTLKEHHEALPCKKCGKPKAWINQKGVALCADCRSGEPNEEA